MLCMLSVSKIKIAELTVSWERSPRWGGTAIERHITFNSVVDLQNSCVPESVPDHSTLLHNNSVALVLDHTCSGDCDVTDSE